MIKKSPYGKLYSGICYKRGYKSKRVAKQRMKETKHIGVRMKSAYKCKRCGNWHLSHLSTSEYKQKVIDFKLIDFLESELGASQI